MLLYVSEGFLPFLQAFYSLVYKNQRETELDFTNAIYKALIVSVAIFFAVTESSRIKRTSTIIIICIRRTVWETSVACMAAFLLVHCQSILK